MRRVLIAAAAILTACVTPTNAALYPSPKVSAWGNCVLAAIWQSTDQTVATRIERVDPGYESVADNIWWTQTRALFVKGCGSFDQEKRADAQLSIQMGGTKNGGGGMMVPQSELEAILVSRRMNAFRATGRRSR